MLNTLLQSLSENNLVVLVVLLFLFIRLQFHLHREMAGVRKEIAEGDAALRKDMADGFTEVRKEIAEGDTALRKDMTDGFAKVRKEMTDGFTEVRKEISDTRGDLRNDIGKVSERVARIEGSLGLPPPCAGKRQPGTPPGGGAMPDADPVADL